MKRLVVFGLGMAMLCGAVNDVPAEEVQVSGDMGLGMSTAFLWRGKIVSDDIAVQPDITVRSEPWVVNVWGSWDLDTSAGDPVKSRVDISILYDQQWRDVVFGLGVFAHIFRDSPNGDKDTYEAYASIGGNFQFEPLLEVFYDFGTIEATYVKFSFGYGYEIAEGADLSVRVGVGAGSDSFNKKFYGARVGIGSSDEAPMDEAGFADFTALLSATSDLGYDLAIIPGVEYVALLDTDLKKSARADGDDPENVVGSLAIKWYF
jgi:hypothetical protein